MEYTDKDMWVDRVVMPDRATPVEGGPPEWSLDGRLIGGYANVSSAMLADRTRWLKNALERIPVNDFPSGVITGQVLKWNSDSNSWVIGEDNNTTYIPATEDADGLMSAADKQKIDKLPSDLTKADVGLGNVDNTSDADKPISTAAANALNTKFDKTGGSISGAVFLERTDNVSGGGEISFARASDNIAAFAIDVEGLGPQPNLRIINVANENTLLPLTIIGSNGAVLASTTGGLGYGHGAGGTVVQPTSKSTPVTINTPCGVIVTSNSTLAAGASVNFTVHNSRIIANDVVIAQIRWLNVLGENYRIEVVHVGNGAFTLRLTNISTYSLAEQIEISFALIKGSSA